MWSTIRLVVSVIAYPAISSKHGETVCVAGIRSDNLMTPSWVRLFPFQGRTTDTQARVHKWDEIELRVQNTSSDHRPESLKPDLESIRVVGSLDSKRGWSDRKALVDPLPRYETMRQVLEAQDTSAISLAVVDPGSILDIEIKPKPAAEIAELEQKAEQLLKQGSLFDVGNPRQPLEPMPVDFYYVVKYSDEDKARRLKIVDWEINQAWRKWRHEYDDPAEAIRKKWLGEIGGGSKDVAFFVGNMHRFPKQFLLLGVFWPPKLPI